MSAPTETAIPPHLLDLAEYLRDPAFEVYKKNGGEKTKEELLSCIVLFWQHVVKTACGEEPQRDYVEIDEHYDYVYFDKSTAVAEFMRLTSMSAEEYAIFLKSLGEVAEN